MCFENCEITVILKNLGITLQSDPDTALSKIRVAGSLRGKLRRESVACEFGPFTLRR